MNAKQYKCGICNQLFLTEDVPQSFVKYGNVCNECFEAATKLTCSKENDPVNHPKHYTSDPSGIECIEITRHRNFNIGNAIKYLWRAGLKDGEISKELKQVEDLKKAIWYINDEIKRITGTTDK